MSDANLIKGQQAVSRSSGFVDYAKQTGGADYSAGSTATVAANKKAYKNKVAEINAKVNTEMGKMKSDIDLTGFSTQEQKGIRSFLMAERNRYAQAANEIARIGDASSPEYQHWADIMNEVNNSFVNLKTQLDSYKENKLEFAEGVRTGMWSEGNDDESYAQAAAMYGLVGGEKTDATFKITQGGNLGFDVNGQILSYKDFEQPFTKDYAAASQILELSNTLYNSGNKMTDANADLVRLQLSGMLSDPNTLKSLINDFANDGLNLSDIQFNPDDIEGTRNAVMERLMGSFKDVANQGYRNKKPRGNYTPSGGSFNQTQQTAIGYFKNGSGSIPLSGGYQARAIDADGNFIIDANTGLPREGADVAGYAVGKFETKDGATNWVAKEGTEQISIEDDPSEFVRKAGIK